MAAAAGAAALVVQLRWHEDPAGRPRTGRRLLRALTLLCDVWLSALAVFNVAVVGAGIGAYHWRMVGAIAPHGPVELVAFSIALSFYLRARRARLPVRTWVGTVALVASLLVVAALLETFVFPGLAVG
jgi:uncharacterized membrane protein SpoIIM required for sporulation